MNHTVTGSNLNAECSTCGQQGGYKTLQRSTSCTGSGQAKQARTHRTCHSCEENIPINAPNCIGDGYH